MNRKLLFTGILTILLLSVKLPASADSSSLFRYAGTVEPIENKNVIMTEESVYIKVFGSSSAACCEFVFKNDSPDEQEVLMGFPASKLMEGMEIDPTTKLVNFKVLENGEEKPAKLESSGKMDKKLEVGKIAEWYTWNVHFKGGEEKRIVNTYTAQNYDAPWARRVGYILKTGAPWKGNIGKALITFELMDISPAKINAEFTRPLGYKIDRNKVIYELKDFEPGDDIGLTFDKGSTFFESALNGVNGPDKSGTAEKLKEVHELYMADRYDEACKILEGLLESGIYNEQVCFYLLNYYFKKDNQDMFIKTLREESERINSPRIYEWALAVYPDRVKSEKLEWPKEHKPVIKKEDIRLIDDKTFELTVDLHDEARDMMFLTVNSWTDPLSLQSVLKGEYAVSVFGKKDYTYRNQGTLPDKYNSLVYCLDVYDYAGNGVFSKNSSGYNQGESCFFYTGTGLERWKVENEELFILCYYNSGFSKYAGDFKKALKDRLTQIRNKYGIKIPEGGYAVSLYDASHLDKLDRRAAQNMTKVVKRNYFNSRVHNGEKLDRDQWDWDEIIIGIDAGDIDKMVESAMVQVVKKGFGDNLVVPMTLKEVKTAAEETATTENIARGITTEGAEPVPVIEQKALKADGYYTTGSLIAALGAVLLLVLTGFIIYQVFRNRKAD